MECLNTIRGLSRYLDGVSTPEEQRIMDRHLKGCARCSERVAEYREMRRALASLPRRAPSAELQTRLKVIASREQFRQRTRVSFSRKWTLWRDRFALSLSNLMRPLMLPVAGGFASACLLFGMLVPDFTVEVHPVHNDVPTPVLYTQASLNLPIMVPITDSEIEIDVHIDEQGRMMEYHVISGQNLLRNAEVRRRLESQLLITQFVPATTFGQPTTGRIRVRFDEVQVKG